MKRDLLRATVSFLCLLTAMPATVVAQSYVPAPYAAPQPDLSVPPPPDEGGALAAPPTAAAPQAAFTQAQLEQILAPIALYPDDLLSNILMASTYPLDVVEASRWAHDPNNAGLRGDALTAALEQQQWDPSVKALVPFPQVLDMLNERLDWTQELGQAFLAQQDQVMDSVQRLRQQAAANNALQSTPQQQVIQDQGVIQIQPADPTVVYVPSYDPRLVYGAWAYPDYPPLYFAPPPVYVVRPAYPGFAFFTAGVLVGGAAWWGWHHWDWHDHRINVDPDRFARLNFGHPPPRRDVWVHDAGRDRGFSQRVFAGRGFAPAPARPGAGPARPGFAERAPAPGARPFADRAAPGPGPRSFQERAAPNAQAAQPRFAGRAAPGTPQAERFARQAPAPQQPRNSARPERAPQPQTARPERAPQPQAARPAPQPQRFAHTAPPQQHAAAPQRPAPQPQPQRAQFAQHPSSPPPQQHAAPQPRPAPQAQRAQFAQRPSGPPPQAHAAPPQQHAAAPQQHAAPQQGGKGGGGRPDDHKKDQH